VRSLGLKAVVARSGREALRLARARAPAGILLDIRLPDIDGFAVRQELRSDSRTSSIPVHFVSAMEAPRGPFGTDSVGYLEKPASRDSIVKVIQTLMRPAPTGSSRVLVIEDDPDQAQIIVELLEKAHLQAITANTADDAVRALVSERFGCVILDLGLPDTDGLRLLEKLKTQSDIWLPPVVVHTGRALSRDETRRLREYAEAVVLKEGRSAARLVDEVQTFVGRVRGNLQHPSPLELQALANSDVVLEGTQVLIADDDMRTVYALSALLRGKGADVLVAETGREALRVLDENQNVGVVLMDIMMPDMDGYEAMRRLRSEPRYADLPVIALTARAMKGERERCEEAGANDYMQKPVDPRGLLSTLHHWLSREHTAQTLS
jgi:CheY-like chemotaxis protein